MVNADFFPDSEEFRAFTTIFLTINNLLFLKDSASLSALVILEGFHKWGIPSSWMVYNGKSENKMDDLGVPPFLETSIYSTVHVYIYIIHVQYIQHIQYMYVYDER
jgi:hypothetical protein